jgi:hypothetical protein
MDDNHIVLAKTVKKDVENILSLNNSMLSIAGIVDSLFNTANENIVENQSTVELKTETSRNLVFSMFDVFYIFSLSDLLVTLKLGNKINFIEDMNQNNNFGMNERIILKNNGLNNNLYDVIKHFFIIQNIGNHDKVFLNILKNFNIG